MTSSLVGSEMCIRYRASSGGPAILTMAAFSAASAVDPLVAAERLPVSYTHLTLPTICSV
eukprot:5258707-Prorocentrum_lima.AAC.1